MIILRDDQQRIKNGLYNNWNSGIKNNLIVQPTGGGKSVIVSGVTLDLARQGAQQAIIAHRNELVSQMSVHVARREIPHRIIGSDATVQQIQRIHRKIFNKSFVNPSARTAVIGVDTLISRYEQLEQWATQISHWQLDEAHHALKGNKWGKAIDMFPNAIGAGYTATPCRADGKGLGRHVDGVFDQLILGASMRYLIGINALSDYEIVCPKSDLEIDDQEVSADGDWSIQKRKEAAKKSHIVRDAVNAYCRYAYGRKAILFATDIETAGKIADDFKRVGIKAAALSSETNFAVREKYIEDFKTGVITVLINVDLFDEGFDVPACEVVVMARPTASLGKYRQMVGRALRYVAGKIALIIDLVSNVLRHGLPDKFIAWSLDRRDKRAKVKDPEEIDLIDCKSCARPYKKFLTCCPYCGNEQPLPEPRDRTVKMVEGDLILLDRATLELMRRATELESPASVFERVAGVAGDFAAKGALNKQIEKHAAHDRLKFVIAQWAGIERAKGHNDREIQRKFYLTLGVDVLSALDGSQTRDQFDKLTDTIERWYKNV